MAATLESNNEGMAYKQELHRGLNLLGTFATSFAQQGVMASTTLLFGILLDLVSDEVFVT
jgi:hypothetical protein